MTRNSAAIFSAIFFGLVFNQGYVFSYMIKYLLMIMLFFPFLAVTFPKNKIIYLHVLGIFLVMGCLAVAFFNLFKFWNYEVATAAFLVAFTPTAIAAPVVISLLKKNVDYVISSVIITNCLVASCIPLIIPFIMPANNGHIPVLHAFFSSITVVMIPLCAAQLIKHVSSQLTHYLMTLNGLVFFLWLMVLYLASAKTSVYLVKNPASLELVFNIALVSLLICVTNFTIGRFIGGALYAREASHSLGHKNTMFMTWIALEYFNSLVAIGPVVYIIYQNIYNSILLSRAEGDK